MKNLLYILIALQITGCAMLSYPANHKSRDEIRSQFPYAQEITIGQIKHGQIDIGMTKAMVYEAWGKPFDVNYIISRHGTRTQWQYGGYVNAKYVYFNDGFVTTIQQ